MALIACPDCGNPTSLAAGACPKCGRPMQPPPLAIDPTARASAPGGGSAGKIFAGGCVGCLGVVFALYLVGAFSAATTKRLTASSAPSRRAWAVTVKDFTWKTEAFDTLMRADFLIRNDGDVEAKDVEITCTHAAPSGTVIDKNVRTIYQTFSPHSERWIKNFDMGFIHSQATKSGCTVTDFKTAP